MSRSRCWWALWWIVAATTGSCSSREKTKGLAAEAVQPPGPLAFRPDSGGGRELSGLAAVVRISLTAPERPPEIAIDFTVTRGAAAEPEYLAVTVAAPPKFLDAHSVRAPVTAKPLRSGQSSVVTWRGTAAASLADRGEVTLAVHDGRLAGAVKGAPAEYNGTFEGKFIVLCQIPPELLSPNTPAPVVTAGGGSAKVLILDDKLQSETCRRLVAALDP